MAMHVCMFMCTYSKLNQVNNITILTKLEDSIRNNKQTKIVVERKHQNNSMKINIRYEVGPTSDNI